MAENAHLQGTIHVRVTENVTLDNLQQIVAHIVGMTGCRTCGIMGIDLRLSGDPVELQRVAKLPGVKTVEFGQ